MHGGKQQLLKAALYSKSEQEYTAIAQILRLQHPVPLNRLDESVAK